MRASLRSRSAHKENKKKTTGTRFFGSRKSADFSQGSAPWTPHPAALNSVAPTSFAIGCYKLNSGLASRGASAAAHAVNCPGPGSRCHRVEGRRMRVRRGALGRKSADFRLPKACPGLHLEKLVPGLHLEKLVPGLHLATTRELILAGAAARDTTLMVAQASNRNRWSSAAASASARGTG